jgi:hypothetical protein
MLDADLKTITRWLRYFRESFPKSRTWQTVRGFISPVVAPTGLPGTLVAYYLESNKFITQAVIHCLVLLTAGSQRVKMMQQ